MTAIVPENRDNERKWAMLDGDPVGKRLNAEIDGLRAENEKLRAALSDVAETIERGSTGTPVLEFIKATLGNGAIAVNPELKEALESLRDFREFTISNATQWRIGANHHNPMWVRVANLLDRHGMNASIPSNTFRCPD
jgi:hypothetical protein